MAKPTGSPEGVPPADVRLQALLDATNRAGITRGATALAHRLVDTGTNADRKTPDLARALPVVPELTEILPGGLRRGAVYTATGSTSLLLTLIAGATAQGPWAAAVGLPRLGILAAGEDYRIPLERLALIPAPGPDWPTTVGALIDGVDLVVIHAPAATAPVVRSLAARARNKGAVVLATTPWPGAELVIEATSRTWTGLGDGRGRLRHQTVTLQAAGRGKAVRARTTTMSMPPESIAGPRAELRIPPPPGRNAGLPVPENRVPDLVAVPAPVPRPVSPWEDFERRVPRPGPRRPRNGRRG